MIGKDNEHEMLYHNANLHNNTCVMHLPKKRGCDFKKIFIHNTSVFGKKSNLDKKFRIRSMKGLVKTQKHKLRSRHKNSIKLFFNMMDCRQELLL